jgi:hypothetical protein
LLTVDEPLNREACAEVVLAFEAVALDGLGKPCGRLSRGLQIGLMTCAVTAMNWPRDVVPKLQEGDERHCMNRQAVAGSAPRRADLASAETAASIAA